MGSKYNQGSREAQLEGMERLYWVSDCLFLIILPITGAALSQASPCLLWQHVRGLPLRLFPSSFSPAVPSPTMLGGSPDSCLELAEQNTGGASLWKAWLSVLSL